MNLLKRRIHRVLSDERGFAVATAIMVLAIMITLGLATGAMVDNQSRITGKQRVKETSFTVSEAVLNAQAIQLSETWPGSKLAGTGGPYPSTCVRADSNTNCPDSTALSAGFAGTEFSASTGWTVTVRDNVGAAANYYDKATLDATACPSAAGTMTPCTWDSNADGAMWVRAQAVVSGETRTVVALVKLNLVSTQFPQNTITAGKFMTGNSGKKVIVDTKGCAAVGAPVGGCKSQRAAPVVVRCAANPPYSRSGTPCMGFEQNKGQVSPPDSVQTGFAGRALPVNAVDDFRRRAKALGTYYPAGTCPSSLTGAVVFIENAVCLPGGPYTTGTFNSAAAPGLVVINNGTLSLGGNVTYYGVIYAANAQNSTGNVITLGGTATIQGAIAVEGGGGVLAGSSKLNIVYDPAATANLFGYGATAEVSQNTFRELPRGQ
jgi:Tfp pilus assembly protein PilX